MRVDQQALITLLCASSALLVTGYVTAPFHDAAWTHACAGEDGEAELGQESLAGMVLVAAPALEDAYFGGTMIYLLVDDAEGTLGVVLNRPRDVRSGLMVWDGGPVGRDRVFVLHDDLDDPRSVRLGDVAVAAEPSVLTDVLDGVGPASARVFVGYAGWAPGQLTEELASGAWIVAEPAPGLVLLQ